MKKKIMFVQNVISSNNTIYYGPLNNVRYLKEALNKTGISVYVYNIPVTSRYTKFKLQFPFMRYLLDVMDFQRHFKNFKHYVKNVGCVDIHYMKPGISVVCALLAKLFGLPVYTHLYFPIRNRIWWKLMKKLVSKFISMNREMTEFVINNGLSSSKVITLPPPIDCEKFRKLNKKKLRKQYSISNEKFIIGYHGRLTKYRGLEILFQVLRTLKDKYDINAFLSIAPVQEDISFSHLVRKIEEYGLSSRIILKIGENNPADIYNVADIMFFPFISPDAVMVPPLSVLEAMACESVVISSDFRGLGLNTFIKHGYNGFLVPCNVKNLADCIENLYNKTECSLREIGKRARETILLHCSYPVVAEKFIRMVSKNACRV